MKTAYEILMDYAHRNAPEAQDAHKALVVSTVIRAITESGMAIVPQRLSPGMRKAFSACGDGLAGYYAGPDEVWDAFMRSNEIWPFGFGTGNAHAQKGETS